MHFAHGGDPNLCASAGTHQLPSGGSLQDYRSLTSGSTDAASWSDLLWELLLMKWTEACLVLVDHPRFSLGVVSSSWSLMWDVKVL